MIISLWEIAGKVIKEMPQTITLLLQMLIDSLLALLICQNISEITHNTLVFYWVLVKRHAWDTKDHLTMNIEMLKQLLNGVLNILNMIIVIQVLALHKQGIKQ